MQYFWCPLEQPAHKVAVTVTPHNTQAEILYNQNCNHKLLYAECYNSNSLPPSLKHYDTRLQTSNLTNFTCKSTLVSHYIPAFSMQIPLNKILLRSGNISVFVTWQNAYSVFHLIAKVIEKNVQPILSVFVPLRVFLMQVSKMFFGGMQICICFSDVSHWGIR